MYVDKLSLHLACRFVSILFASTSFFSLFVTLWICVKVLIHEKRNGENIRSMERLRLERGKKLGTGLHDRPKRYRG